jgi:hypothetical protein
MLQFVAIHVASCAMNLAARATTLACSHCPHAAMKYAALAPPSPPAAAARPVRQLVAVSGQTAVILVAASAASPARACAVRF